jgi:amino acid permease
MTSPRKFSTPSTSHSACRDADDDDYEHADWFTRTFRPISPGSLRAAMFIQMSCCVGAGILTLPAVIVMVGVAPFVGMLTFSAIIAYLNWVNFARVAHTLRETTDIEISWGSIIQHLFGSWGIPALTFMIMIDCLGALVYLLILAGQFLAVVLPDYRTFDSVQPLLPEWFLDLPRDAATVFIPLLFPMFLISLKDLNSLRYIGTYSIFLIVLIIFIVVVNAPAKYFSHNPDKRNIVFFNDSGWKEGLQGISICMWSFLSQWNLYNIIHGMDNHRRFSRVDKVLVRSTFATFCMYLIFGISGYLSFLHHTKGNLLQNYCAKDITLVILKAIFGCQLISVLPFMVWPLRDCVVYFCTEWLGMSSGRFVHGTLGYNLIGFSWLWFAV